MSFKNKKINLILIILNLAVLGTLFSVNLSLLFIKSASFINYKQLKLKDLPKLSLTFTSTIIDDLGGGDYTWEEATNQDWCNGSGTLLDPYIIEGHIWNMSAGNDGLKINNSNNKYFIIKNCTFKWNELTNTMIKKGIYLRNTTHGQLIDNRVYHLEYGIVLEGCNHINITNNEIDDHIYDHSLEAISLDNSNFSNILGNTLYDTYRGIYVKNSNYIKIIDNKIYDQIHDAIRLENCNSNELLENNLSFSQNGLHISDSDFNNISKNIAFNNTQNGLILLYCHNNTISKNTLDNNTKTGLTLEQSHNNTVLKNSIENNNVGITKGTQSGIYLKYSFVNEIYRNLITKNKDGINLYTSDTNIIYENKLNNNSWRGIYIDDGDESSDNNFIYFNFFIENVIHAIDDVSTTMWNTTVKGNYWDNYTEPDVDPPDGFVDAPYNISGKGKSKDYLPIAEDGVPEIHIITPSGGDVFDALAPSFNIIIYDFYIICKWYTLDGGITNYTFIESGIINQSVWDDISKGYVTLTFYAEDITGNIGTENVTIAKDFESPTININSPSSGEFFGISAPSFNVRITDDYLDSMWYTIDGGLHNYSFTENGTIEQLAWDAMSDGVIPLTFYANDTLGNNISAEVAIEKDGQAPTISINSPSEGDKFGKTSPSFNLTVADPHLDTIWYMVDGGVFNITCSASDTINQTLWAALPKGEVTITFYANDSAANIASKSVTVIKKAPSEIIGLDFFTTNIFVSIFCGVALIAIISKIHSKKKSFST